MAGQSSTTEVCRLVVVGPASQVDLSVPTHIPLVDLMPALLRGLGPDLADRGLEHSGWVLQRLGEAPLDEDSTVADLGLLDGDTLHMRPRSDQIPPLDFDDLIDGVATGMRARSGLWRPRHTRLASLATLAALLTTALALPLTTPALSVGGPAREAAAGRGWAVALAVAAAVLYAVTVLAGRVARDPAIAAVVGAVTVVCVPEAVTLALVDAGPGHGRPTLGGLVLVGAAVGAAAALTLLIAAGGLEALLQVGTAIVVLALAAVLAGWLSVGPGVGWTQTAALELVLAVAVRPAVPVAGFKLAGMALPVLPVEPEELQDDIDPEPGPEVLARTAMADRYMTALHTAWGVVSGVAFVRLAAAPGWVPGTLAALVAAAQLLTLRPMTSGWHRLALGVPAGVGLLAVLALGVARAGTAALWLALWLALVCAAVTRVLARRRLSPLWGRLGDWAHTLALVMAVPLVVSVFGAISWVRSVVG
jgi:type VII secretion integral membrane protein EccD